VLVTSKDNRVERNGMNNEKGKGETQQNDCGSSDCYLANHFDVVALIDRVCELVDKGIRKSQFSTYDEWETAIYAILEKPITIAVESRVEESEANELLVKAKGISERSLDDHSIGRKRGKIEAYDRVLSLVKLKKGQAIAQCDSHYACIESFDCNAGDHSDACPKAR